MSRHCLFVIALLLLGGNRTAAHAQPVPDSLLAVAPADTSQPGDPVETSRQAEVRRFRPARFWLGVGGIVAVDVPVMYGLSQIWYGEGTTSFHWYSEAQLPQFDHGWLDDWYEWKQQDKLGHVFVAWHLARVMGAYGRWSGLSRPQAALFGGTVSALFQSQIEIFDGHSKKQDGASRTDILANVAGGFIGSLQVAYPEKLDWFTAKYSYHPSPYYGTPPTGPPGNGVGAFLGNVIKDYDGISYWLVIRPEELLSERYAQKWPDWLAFSVGHSGTGLAFPKSGVNGPEHRRQLFISPDIDLLHQLDVPQPFKAIADFFSFVRLPAPALQLTPEVRWYWVFY